MDVIGRIKLHKRPGTRLQRRPTTTVTHAEDPAGRIAWLEGFCGLRPRDVELLTLVAGLRGGSPDEQGWTWRAVAFRLDVPERVVCERLHPSAPLVRWGLVRGLAGREPRIALVERTARFLFASGRLLP